MSKAPDWDDQRAFLAAIEAGSLSGAARSLGVAQPTVRARIEALEASLGVTLFTRSVRGLAPTREARALGDHVRAMARASEAFVRAASAGAHDLAGVVRVSVSEFVGVEVLPAMLSPLRQRHPELILEIEISNAVANLLEQAVDVAVRMHPPRQQALVAQKAPAVQLGLFAHADYLARRGAPARLADLADHDIIGPDRSAADHALAELLFPSIAAGRMVLRTDSHPAQLAAIRAGLGIGVVQTPIGLGDPSLRPVLPDLPIPPIETWIVTHENLRQVPRVRAVFDHLVREFSEYGVRAIT